ncbi:MAG: 6-bladed beta-propeller [Gemmatimonadaceae bacterium]|jgi:hypothetical protein|nr:6-bladed beta-propeller [Gemmatimonadaceae bacterium]
MSGRKHLFFLIAALIVAIGPSSSAAQPTVAGAATDQRLNWRLQRVWHIGGSEDETLLLSQLFDKDLAADRRGRLLVVDRTENRIVVYDSTGRQLRTYGKKGPGPGELMAPLWVEIRSDDRILVGDAEKNSVVVYGPDGATEPEFRLTPRLRSARALPGGAYLGPLAPARDSTALVAVSLAAPVTLVRMAVPRPRSTPPVCRLTDYPAGPIFAPTLTWAARGDRVVASTGGFRIQVFRGTTLQRTLTRDTPLRPSSTALARQHLGPGETVELFGMPPCTVPASLILSVAEVAPTLPAYSALTIAPDERVWATR